MSTDTTMKKIASFDSNLVVFCLGAEINQECLEVVVVKRKQQLWRVCGFSF
jgi:hypothetical protein